MYCVWYGCVVTAILTSVLLLGCVVSLLMVTEQVSVFPPSAVAAIIFTVPAETAVTLPFETVAFVASLVDHVTALFVAFAGETVAVNVAVSPTLREIRFLLSFTPVTETVDIPSSPPLQAIENPITAASAIIPNNFNAFFIENSLKIKIDYLKTLY
jgi:hypothetical protein